MVSKRVSQVVVMSTRMTEERAAVHLGQGMIKPTLTFTSKTLSKSSSVTSLVDCRNGQQCG